MLVEPDISPLAKRLAEENNVNWRGLLGSGAGGKIVERDVLEYLAKVMAGEEDINPTAEPLPEGMDAWPEDDVRSFYGGAMPAEGAQAEAPSSVTEEELFVDTPDLGSFDTGSFDTPAAVSSVSHQTTEDVMGLGEDIFLIDDEVPVQSASLDVSGMVEEPAFVSEIEAFGEDALSSDDMAMVDDGLGMDDIATFDEPEGDVFAAMSEGVEEMASDNDVEDLASLFADGAESIEDSYSEPATVDQTVAFEAPAMDEFDIPAYQAEVTSAEDVVEALATENVDDVIASFEEDNFETVGGLEDSFIEEMDEPAAQTFMVDEPVVETPVFETPVFETPVFEAPQTPVVEVPPMPSFSEVVPVAATVAGAGLAASALSAGAPVLRDPVVTPAASLVVQGNLPLVSYGVLLRRHVDLSTLMHAQQAIADETGQEETSVASLLLRAAAKAQQKISLVPGRSVGLAIIRNEGVSVAHVHDAAGAPFRTVMSQAQQALSAHREDKVDLAVADMSNFDIDEAVLNIGVPVLTLGRTMYDSSKGTHHSTLSLSGNISVESGTKFLSMVAELLNSPVRLVI